MRPFLPTRCCLKISGPLDSSFSGIATIKIIGKERIVPTIPPIISTKRLNASLPGLITVGANFAIG